MSFINIAVIGDRGSGKTTLVNAILAGRYGDHGNSTMVESVYRESFGDQKADTPKDVLLKNTMVNSAVCKRGSRVSANEIFTHQVPAISGFARNLATDIHLAIHDLPGFDIANPHGFNAARELGVYDIVIVVVTMYIPIEEHGRLFRSIFEEIKKNRRVHNVKTEVIVVVNKCDNMEITIPATKKTEPTGLDQKRAVRDILAAILSDREVVPNVVFMSAEDSYIYRTYERDPEFIITGPTRDRFAGSMFGKILWSRLNEAEKDNHLRNGIVKSNIEAGLDLAGFTYLDHVITGLLSRDAQFEFLLNKFKLKMSATYTPAYFTINEHIMRDFKIFCEIISGVKDVCWIFWYPLSRADFFKARFRQYFGLYKNSVSEFLKPGIIRETEKYEKAKFVFKIAILLETELSDWCELSDISDFSKHVIAGNINSYIIGRACDTSIDSKELENLLTGIFLPDHIPFGQDDLDHIIKSVDHFHDQQSAGFGYGNSSVINVIRVEILSVIWKYNKIPWSAKLDLVDAWINNYDVETRAGLVLMNLRQYLEVNMIDKPTRWRAIKAYERYYINSEFLQGGHGFDTSDLLSVEEYLRCRPDGANVPPSPNNNGIVDAVKYCLSGLHDAFPEFVTDLDKFYAGRGGSVPNIGRGGPGGATDFTV